MLIFFISLLGILITIFLIVGLHEFGHFLAARLVGVKVLRFSIGFGKPLFKKKDKKGTEYILAAIPLGGYVKMLDETEGNVSEEEASLAFNRQPFYKKCIIVAAGPFTNFLLAFFLYWLLFIIGFTSITPVIGKVRPHSIAAEAGVKPFQEITRIDDKITRSWMGVMIRLLSHTGEKGHLILETQSPQNPKNTQQFSLDLTHWQMDNLKPDPIGSLGLIPYAPDPQKKWPAYLLRKNKYNAFTALSHAWQNTYDFTYLNLLVIGKLLTGKVSLQSLGGPIFIFQNAGEALNQGIIPFMSFLAFLSIAIGVINIFPIPGLDGGHLFFQLIEILIRRPIPLAILNLCYRLGMIMLFLLIAKALVNDVLRLH